MKPKFITFEGAEFSGKSTQSRMLHEYFMNSGIKAILTREPGGTSFGEIIREIFINSQNLTSTTELLLNMSARSEHISKVIIPAINVGINVICDRFIDSTCAYQGVEGEIGVEKVLALHQMLFNNLMPDITFFLDIHPEEALTRAKLRKEEINRFDNKNIEFHIAIYKAFKKIAMDNPDRIVVIDGTMNVYDIHNHIINSLQRLS
jgi:dTMP kinase